MTSDDVIAELGDRGLLLIITRLAEEHGVTVDAIAGRQKTKSVSTARRKAWAAIRSERNFSYTEIGRLFGRDHTTIITGVRRTQREAAA